MIPKRFNIRHKTLEILSEHYIEIINQTDSNIIDENELYIPVVVIADKLNVTETYLKKCCATLVFDKEVEYSFNPKSDQEVIRLATYGLRSFVDKKYIITGQKIRLDSIYDYFRIVSGILLLVIALWTFISNVITTNKNQQKIIELQDQIKELQLIVNKSK